MTRRTRPRVAPLLWSRSWCLWLTVILVAGCSAVKATPSSTPAVGISSPAIAATETEAPPTLAASPTLGVTSSGASATPTQEILEAAATTQIKGANNLAWSPTGSIIAVTGQDGLHLISGSDLTELAFSATEPALGSVAFDTDGQYVATADLAGDSYQVWEAGSGRQVRQEDGFINGVFRVAYGLEGALYVTAEGSPSDLWVIKYVDSTRAGGGSAPGVLGFDTMFGYLATVNPNGSSFAVVGRDGIEIWDMGSPGTIRKTLEVRSPYDSFAFDPSGRLLAVAHEDCTVTEWDVGSGQIARSMHWCDRTANPPTRSGGLAFSRDGSLLAAGGVRGQVDIWSVSSGELVGELSGGSLKFLALDFSPDSEHLVSLDDKGNISIWSTPTLSEPSQGE